MTRLLLIRHATYAVHPHTLAGHTPGLALDAAGVEQARTLAAQLAHLTLAALYASPLERTMATAEILAAPHALVVQPLAPFTELDVGSWTGKTFAQLQTDARWNGWNTTRSMGAAPAGEVLVDVLARVVNGLRWLVQHHPQQTVALVSHCDIIRLALIYALGMPIDHFLRLRIDPASVSVLHLTPASAPEIVCINASTALTTLLAN